MAGEHRYTSSLFVQSGSTAVFKSGLEVSQSITATGNIIASSFTGDGSALTGITQAQLFAGTGSAISGSPPTSGDQIIILSSGQAAATAYPVLIQTTHSAAFTPNYYSFIKITDTFKELQSSGLSSYTATDNTPGAGDPDGLQPFTNDLAPGVHRYLVYASDTGSTDATELVYTTIFIKGFVNVAPEIEVANTATITFGHDENTATRIFRLTGSEDVNENDFIRIYSASRLTEDPITVTADSASYSLLIKHHSIDPTGNVKFIASGSIDPDTGTLGPKATAMPSESLVFTASISNFNVVNTLRQTQADTVKTYAEQFEVYLQDNNLKTNSSSALIDVDIVPPTTASIHNMQLQVESGSFTGIGVNNYETTILYDNLTTLENTSSFHSHVSASMYTSSLIRVSVIGKIDEPAGYSADGTHFTTVRIMSSSNASVNSGDETFKYFRFSGSQNTASRYATTIDSSIQTVTQSFGFTPFIFGPQTTHFGIASDKLDNVNYIEHGDHDHFKMQSGNPNSVLTINAVPNVQISDIVVEVESGSFLTTTGSNQRSASILYGHTQTFLSSETSSLEGFTKSAEYISASIIRLRLRAKIIEPFGPHHTNVTSIISSDVGGHSHTFAFHTGSIQTSSATIAYDSQNRLVGRYTSSWYEFKFNPGKYVFSPTFNTNTNAGQTVDAATNAEVTVSNTPPTQISNISYETEESGYSGSVSFATTRKVLFGINRTTVANSSSFVTHPSASLFASQSVSQFRIRAKIIEPFGPHHTGSSFEKIWTAPGQVNISSKIFFSASSAHVYSSSLLYDDQHRFVGTYTSSWIGQALPVAANSSTEWSYSSGSIMHTPIDNSGFHTSSILNSVVTVTDTAATQITDFKFEIEEYGHSGSGADSSGSHSAMRTVLYGDDHHTLADSSSFHGHPSSSIYASHSVSRGRVKFKVIEPIGPAHAIVQVTPTWNGDMSTLSANTGSPNFELSSSNYNAASEFVVAYTSSWIGRSLTLNGGNYNGNESFVFEPKAGATQQIGISNENGLSGEGTFDNAICQVFDTAPTQVTDLILEIENFGFSASNTLNQTGRTASLETRHVLYGYNRALTVNSSSFAAHISASAFASQSIARTRIRAKIIEPVGPAHNPSSVNKQQHNGGSITNIESLSFVSNSIAVTTFQERDAQKRLITSYTSSWTGHAYTAANNSQTTYNVKPILSHAPTGENGNVSSSVNSNAYVQLRVKDTDVTQITNYQIETETYGESGVGVQNTIEANAGAISRSILYGETLTRLTGSGLPDIYHPHAVTRFRILTQVTEPLGPLNHPSSIRYYMGNSGNGGGSGISNTTIKFSHSASAQLDSFTSGSDERHRIVSRYTSSWISESLEYSYRNDGDVQSYWKFQIFPSQVTHTPANENGETADGTKNLYFVVSASKPLEIENLRVEAEAPPYSSSLFTSSRTTTILYGETSTLTDTQADVIGDIWSGSAAVRLRITGKVIEPLGISHFKTRVSATDKQGHSFDFEFHTGSQQTSSDSSMRALNADNLFTQSFTSSWYGGLTFEPGAYKFTASANTGSNTTGVYLNNLTSDGIETGSVYNALVTVNDTPPTQISNIRVEVEKTNSGSMQGTSSRETTILHGNTSSETDQLINITYPNTLSRNQLVSMRLLANVDEPFGPFHTGSTFTVTGFSDSEVIDYGTVSELALNTSRVTASHHYSTNYGYRAIGSSYSTDWRVRWGNSNNRFGQSAATIYQTSTDLTWDHDFQDPVLISEVFLRWQSNNSNFRHKAPRVSGSNDGINWSGLHAASDTVDGSRTLAFANANKYRWYRIFLKRSLWGTSANNNNEYAGIERVRMYTPNLTEGSGSFIFNMHTGSSQISSSVTSSWYITNGSQSTAYTSSFVPIELTNSAKTDIVFSISASVVSHSFKSSVISFSELASASITAHPPLTASIIVLPNSSSDDTDFSHSIDLPSYVTYNANNDIEIDLVSGISSSMITFTSESHVRFPNHVEIFYDTNNNSELSFSPIKSTVFADRTSSLTIASSDINNFTKVEHFTVNITASGQLSGNGSSSRSDESYTFAVVPTRPQSMQDKYWGSSTATSHDTDSNSFTSTGISFTPINSNPRRMYKASLPTGLYSYKSGHAAGTDVTNVIMTKQSHTGSTNYSMSFTPFVYDVTGDYSDTDRLFNFGDTGSLIVKINGSEVINYNLSTEFETSDKAGEQNISGNYTGGGTASFGSPYAGKGRLIITTVQPFNNVSQSIQNGPLYHSNGYQGWSARIEIDNKLAHGYNNLEFSHSIDTNVTQSWKPFDWYYDDGILGEPTTSMIGSPTLSYDVINSEPTFSLSGVSFFQQGADFLVSLKNRIRNIAHSTYRHTINTSDPVFRTSHAHGGALTLASASVTSTTLDHTIHTVASANGLQFDGFDFNIAPSSSMSASINNLKINATSVTNESNLSGEIYQLAFQSYKRDLSGNDSWNLDTSIARLPIGRFINTSSITDTFEIISPDSTEQFEEFFAESFRWNSSSIEMSASFNFNKDAGVNYGTSTNTVGGQAGFANNLKGYLDFWLLGHLSQSIVNSALHSDIDIGPDFTSTDTLSGTSELQVHYDGRLAYPSINYTDINYVDENNNEVLYTVVNPNAPDYSSLSGDRYFYRAFNTGGGQQFYVTLYTPGTGTTPDAVLGVQESDFKITADDVSDSGIGIDDRDLRIDIRTPGPITNVTSTSNAKPGINWQNACMEKDAGNFHLESAGAFTQVRSYSHGSGIVGGYRIRIDMGSFNPSAAGGVMLMRIRMKSEFDKVITGIGIEPV
tara:strand:+ start:6963 stop:15293 length:8331 start_codon:yes stop_codon:yes gene_type:complete